MLNRLGLVLVLWLALAGVAEGAVINVTRTDDPVGGQCAPTDCSLRQAVAAAIDGDTIQLGGTPSAAQVYKLTQGTQLTITQSITIAGGGRTSSQIDGVENFDALFRTDRIMRVMAPAVVTIRDVTFSGGRDGKDENFGSCSPCPTMNANGGGAIFNAGQLTLERVGFEANQSSPTGGAIGNNGTLSLTDVEFHANSASFGGALFSRGGTVNADRVTIRGNTGSARGGGVFLLGGTLQLTNSTVTGNGQSNAIGGGIAHRGGVLTLRNVTLANNMRGSLLREVGAGAATVQNSILAVGSEQTCFPAGPDLQRLHDRRGDHQRRGLQPRRGRQLRAHRADAHRQPAGLARAGGRQRRRRRRPWRCCRAARRSTRCRRRTAPALDQRGIARQGLCDIGAFEAVKLGPPTVVTGDAEVDADEGVVRLAGAANLAGEAGTLFFEYGTSTDVLTERTPGVALGVVSTPTTRNEALGGLQPATTYYYRAVTENATGLEVGERRSFTTPGDGPRLAELHAEEVTATTARIAFQLDTVSAPTTYTVRWTSANGDGQSAPVTVPAGQGFEDRTHTIEGLAPSTRYDAVVRAVNAGGEAESELSFTTADRVPPDVVVDPTPDPVPDVLPQPTPTPTPTPGPQPDPGKDVVAAPASGTVLVRVPGTSRFVALKAGQDVPYGSEIDTRKGRVTLTSIPKAGAPPETAVFYDGLFKLTFAGGITNLTLSEPLAACPKGRASAAAKKAKSRKLWGKGKGAFRTTGKYSAATVRGTTWLVQDTCAGTLTRVTEGVVEVRDSVTKKKVVVRAGKKYLAKPKRR